MADRLKIACILRKVVGIGRFGALQKQIFDFILEVMHICDSEDAFLNGGRIGFSMVFHHFRNELFRYGSRWFHTQGFQKKAVKNAREIDNIQSHIPCSQRTTSRQPSIRRILHLNDMKSYIL